jgi:hypothetical protein
MAAPLKALTVAPFGMEEGTGAEVPAGEFGLVVGEPAEFRFFASLERKNDALGTLLNDFGDELVELAPVSVCLPAEETAGKVVRVRLETKVTETGVLELWCAGRDGRRWKLEFQVRDKHKTRRTASTLGLPIAPSPTSIRAKAKAWTSRQSTFCRYRSR